MSDLYRLHDELVAEILPRIVKPILAAGGGSNEILVLIESLLAGTAMFVGEGRTSLPPAQRQRVARALIQAAAEGAKGRTGQAATADTVRRILH